jgi:hypothetical protein
LNLFVCRGILRTRREKPAGSATDLEVEMRSDVEMEKGIKEEALAARLRDCADEHARLAFAARSVGGRRFEEARADRLMVLSGLAENRAADALDAALAAS